jgi:hypothetical protein
MIVRNIKKPGFEEFFYKESVLGIRHTFAVITLTILFALVTAVSFAQNAEDTADGRFHDDLLNHLVGKWDATSIVHGQKFTINLEAEWVLNHQYLHIHLKSLEVIPWLKGPFEGQFFFGYNQMNKQYTVQEMTVHGTNGLYEGFCYGYRSGNEFKAVAKVGTDSLTAQSFTWEPGSGTWSIKSRLVVAGKESEPFLEMILVATKRNKKKS